MIVIDHDLVPVLLVIVISNDSFLFTQKSPETNYYKSFL
jgi:hypothetical protein